MGDWYDYIKSAAQDAAQRVKHFYEDVFPDWSKLPIVSNPVVLMVKGVDATITGAVSMATDANIRREGFEPFAKLPDDLYLDEQYSADVQNRSVSNLVADYATATANKVADLPQNIANAFASEPGAMPLWVKLTIGAAVVVGSAVVLQSLAQGKRYA